MIVSIIILIIVFILIICNSYEESIYCEKWINGKIKHELNNEIMQKVYHLEFKATGFHFHYGDLAVMFVTWGGSLKISIDTLYRWDFEKPFENNDIIIRKSELVKSKRYRK